MNGRTASKALIPFALLVFCAAANAPSSNPTSTVTGSPAPSEADIELAARASERREMVRPAGRGFRPTAAGRAVRLLLAARDRQIKVGQTFWYRLELQNVGKEAVRISEDPSFLKNGRFYDERRYAFWIKGPDGQRRRMLLGSFADELAMGSRPGVSRKIPGSDHMTDAEIRDHVRIESWRTRAARRLDVTLRPGETLVSIPWRWVGIPEANQRDKNGLEAWPRPTGEFRELWTEHDFKKPGLYSIVVDFIDRAAPPPDEKRVFVPASG